MDASISILLVGAGKMGSALLQRWKKKFPHAKFEVIEPQASQPGWHKNLESLAADYTPDVIVFAVKPQQLEAILPAYKKRFGSKPLYISIAAGKTTEFFRKHLGNDVRIVRAMPNTPAMVGEGMTVLVASPALSDNDHRIASQLMQAVGIIDWLRNESTIDAVTALSGSGPAYVFLFLDSLIKAGIVAGLDEATAKTLTLQTVVGSVALVKQDGDFVDPNSGESLEELRKNVTSPGGTTEAALKILMEGNALEKLIEKAVLAAAKRSKELSN